MLLAPVHPGALPARQLYGQLPATPAACRLMANQIALLLPHLGGKAYSLRSAIVHAIGSLLHKAFDRSEAGGEGGANWEDV